MLDPESLDPAALRAHGIGDPTASDEELVAMVELLLKLDVTFDQMVDIELPYLAGPPMVRPDASIDPASAPELSDEPAFAEAAMLALGFNDSAGYGGRLTPHEVETIVFFQQLRPLIGEANMLALLRVLGTSSGRVARTVMSALRLDYETPLLEETGSLVKVARSYQELTSALLPPFLDAMSAVLRRHIAQVAGLPVAWSVDGTHAATMEVVVVGFVDLVGFTAFADRAGAKEFIEAVRAFEAKAQDIVVDNGGTLVKLIGDEAMFVAPAVEAGLEIARRLLAVPLTENGPASARIGMAVGQVATLGGDYYGAVVNTAARLVNEAEPDEIVVTKAVHDAAADPSLFISLGARSLKGIADPVLLYRLI